MIFFYSWGVDLDFRIKFWSKVYLSGPSVLSSGSRQMSGAWNTTKLRDQRSGGWWYQITSRNTQKNSLYILTNRVVKILVSSYGHQPCGQDMFTPKKTRWENPRAEWSSSWPSVQGSRSPLWTGTTGSPRDTSSTTTPCLTALGRDSHLLTVSSFLSWVQRETACQCWSQSGLLYSFCIYHH